MKVIISSKERRKEGIEKEFREVGDFYAFSNSLSMWI